MNVPGLHPSEPNYLWLEAGQNFGVTDDGTPSANHQSTTDHLSAQLEKAGLSWKSYQEDIDGTSCPLKNVKKYAPKHNPFVFFDDVTEGLKATSQHCMDHVRPYTELTSDLANDTAPRYAFLTPNLCNDMHDSFGCPSTDSAKNGDDWLSREIPKIQASKAYQHAAIFITWDESEGGDVPIGMIVLSPFAKPGYSNTVAYSHSSMLRTAQTVFNVSPFLGDAANATDLGDLFTQFP
jgi:phospholipase C